MTTTPSPRRTVRRADRYKQENGVSPSTELMHRAQGLSGGIVSTGAAPAPEEQPIHRRAQGSAQPAPAQPTAPQPVPGRPAPPSAPMRPAPRPVPPPYQQQPAPVQRQQPVPVQRQQPVPIQRQQPAPIQRQAAPPPPMDRPPNAPQQKKHPPRQRAPRRMPVWLTASLIAMFFVVLGLFTAQSLMSAYLTRRAQERADAFQQVVDAHPIYYKDLIEQYAAEYNLKPAYVAAIILNESSFRTDAESSVGARGLMQLMPSTAEWIARKLNVEGYSFDRMYDAETNIRFGTWYLNYLSRLFRGDPVLVTAAYHAGQGEVSGWLSDPSMSQDGVTLALENMIDGPTKLYAGRVTQAYGIYEALYYPPDDSDPDDSMPAGVDAARR